MKKFLILGCILVILGSCRLTSIDETTDAKYKELASGHSLYFNDLFYNLTSINTISGFIWSNHSYKTDNTDIWSNPETTFKRGYGDCEDFVILFMNILYISTGTKANLVLVDTNDRSIVEGGEVNHAVVEVNGVLYEPTLGIVVNYPVRYRYKFNEVFN